MKEVGFGHYKGYSALWIRDLSCQKFPDFDYVTFPSRGLYPTKYFSSDWAWSISPNPQKYRRLIKDKIEVTLSLANRRFQKVKELELDYFNVDTSLIGFGDCIIFRPKKIKVRRGYRYLVEVKGLSTKQGKDAQIRYIVEFFKAR